MKKTQNEKIEKYCVYCEKATELSDGEHMLCPKKGVVLSSFCCRAFRYDPLKREPGHMNNPDSLEFISLDL